MSEPFAIRLSRLVSNRTGIVLGRERKGSILQLCTRRAEALHLSSPEEYLRLLEQEGVDGPESNALLTAITNGETAFFRDQRQFAAVSELLRERTRAGAALQIWSAGCASGEEPYSLAIAAAAVPAAVAVLGTDINPAFLAAAEAARYSERALRNVSAEDRVRHFGSDGVLYQPAADIRARVRLRRYNLLDSQVPVSGRADGRWDLILCRNVFIYFERKTVEIVAARLLRALTPDGYLFVGAAESLHGLDVDAVPVKVGGVWAYRARKPSEVPVVFPAPAPPAVPADRRTAATAAARKGAAVPERRVSPEGLTGFRTIRAWLGGASRAQAETHLRQLLEHSPDHLWAHLYLGFLALSDGDGGEALARFEEAHRCDLLLPEVHYCLALAYRRLADRAEYAEALRRTVFLAPEFWPAILLQAGLYREAGRTDMAAAAYRRILEIVGSRKNDREPIALDLPDIEDVALYRDEVATLCRKSLAELDPELKSGRVNGDSSRGRR